MSKLSQVLIFLLWFSSCQTPLKKESSHEISPIHHINSKVKVINKDQGKTHTAKATWYLKPSGLLRLDVLGPFDILMAQGFRDQTKVTLVDHRQKTVLSQSNSKPLIIDGFELPLNDLTDLLLDQSPHGWTCQKNESAKLNCQKGPIQSTWIDSNTLKLNYLPFELEIRIASRIELYKTDSDIFQFIWPKTYRQIVP